mmetsp:Transcript_91246/g.282237  ORF Transcript_91246/g.282237 Transcript_91246/m.282237 type:complete len:1100 (+) Transcript_91246:84-3383(+)
MGWGGAGKSYPQQGKGSSYSGKGSGPPQHSGGDRGKGGGGGDWGKGSGGDWGKGGGWGGKAGGGMAVPPPGKGTSCGPPAASESFSVVGCQHATIGNIVRGHFNRAGDNHGRPTFKKDTQSNGLDVMLYFWDERDGPALCGWWFGPKVGGDQVWAFHPSKDLRPPSSGWMVPFNGPLDPTLAIKMDAVPQAVPASSKGGYQQQSAYQQPAAVQPPAQATHVPPPSHAGGTMQMAQWSPNRPNQGNSYIQQQQQQQQQQQAHQQRLDENRRQQEEMRRRMEENKKKVEEANRKRREEQEAEAKRKVEEQRKRLEEMKKQKEEEERQKREAMEKRQLEMRATTEIRRVQQKVRVSKLENFEEAKKELEEVMERELPKVGDKQQQIQDECEAVVAQVQKRVEAVKEMKRKEEEKKEKEAQEAKKKWEKRAAKDESKHKGEKERTEKPAKSSKDEPEDYTPEELMKKVTEVAQQRGRRGFDKKAYMDKLQSLLPHAVKQGPRAQLYIYSYMVSAEFDNTGTVFSAMRIDLWNEALDKVNLMLPLLVESYKDIQEHGEEKRPVGDDDDESEDPQSHARQQELFVSFFEKLDDELYKALQFTVDVYGAEYQEILANSSKFLVLLMRVLRFYEDTQQKLPLSTASLRLMEQVYYKPDMLNKAVFEAIQSTMDDDEKPFWVWPEDSPKFMGKLCRYVFAIDNVKNKRRAMLCQAYHLALHDRFQSARDLLQLGNLSDQAMESDVHTQILYNRCLAQMGLSAFRLGKIQDAHNCLMDFHMHNKARELLAQGLNYNKNMDRTPEQERQERLRQLPYHMYINLEVLETAHLICAMLLEVPNLAMQSIDPTNNKRVISKVLRRTLETYDKLPFTGPPENHREAVVSAAKALQRGDWQSACGALEDLKLWDHIDPADLVNGKRVKEMIKGKIKTEALRTYLFAYASIYDAFHLNQLAEMFDLEGKIVHSVVSKMMIKEEITAFWDESSKFVLVQHVEPTPLQRLALALAEKGAQAVENNERLVDQKTGGYGFKDQRPQQGGRWDQVGGGGGRGRFGKGGGGMAPAYDDGKGRKGKGRGKSAMSRPPQNRGWENARAGALRGNPQRGWGAPRS